MNFMERIGGGGFLEQEQSDEEEERIEEEAKTTRRNNITSSTSKHQYISNLPSTSSSSGSAAATTPPHHFSYKDFLPRLSQEFTHPRTPPPPPGAHLAGGEGTSSMMMMEEEVEKEHMFEKVVTPSDVGKLNRLVIPKQHAERHFPLDGSSNEKGLLLNFEDPDGKPWRFRYSYWNSSQSYVMTKGWSRFVKDKKLDAGDIVSFHRGAREDSRHRLFIDWKRRPTIDFPNVRWGNRLLYALPHAPAPPPFHYSYNLQVQPYPGHYSHLYARGGPTPYYVRPTGHLHNHYLNAGEGGGISGGVADGVLPMVIDSVPVVQGRTVGKRLRLFGVNMDCPISGSGYDHQHQHHHHHHHPEEADNRPMHGLILPPPRHSGSSSSSSPGAGSSLQLRQPSGGGGGGSSTSTQSHELSKKGKSTSLSFDLDL